MGEVQYVEPQNVEAEQSTLGSMLLDKKALAKGLEMLEAADFTRPTHQEIFDALKALGERDEPIDLITLQEELRKRGKLDECGGTEYLMALVDSVPTAKNIEYYANIVKVKANNRRIIAENRKVIAAAMDPAAGDMTDFFIQTALNVNKNKSGDIRHASDIIDDITKELNDIENGIRPFSVRFRLKAFQLMYPEGMTKDSFTIIAAETSEGKSVALADIAEAGLSDHVPTLLVTCEMSDTQYLKRMICSKMRIEAASLRQPGINFNTVIDGMNKYFDKPFWIYDASPTMTQLEAITRRWALQNCKDGRGQIIVDYAGLITREASEDQENTETTRIIHRLKKLQRSLSLPLATASQFRKQGPGAKKYADDAVWTWQPCEVPFRSLEDLIGSSAIKDDADNVLIVYNPRGAKLVDGKRPAFFYNAKHRNGEVGHKVMVWFTPQYTRFDDCEGQWIPEIPPTPEVTFSGTRQQFWNKNRENEEYEQR